jgi:hypothetical protein
MISFLLKSRVPYSKHVTYFFKWLRIKNLSNKIINFFDGEDVMSQPSNIRLFFAFAHPTALRCRNVSPDPNTPSTGQMQSLLSPNTQPHSGSPDPSRSRAL